MNTKVKPGVALLAILATIGVAVAIMFAVADRRQPHLPNGPSMAMRAGRAAQSGTSPNRGAPSHTGMAGAARAAQKESPAAPTAPHPQESAGDSSGGR
jgi:hypothetical protein